jgi:3-oxoadipate enol-lactonase
LFFGELARYKPNSVLVFYVEGNIKESIMKIDIDGGFLVCDKEGSGIPLLFIHGYPLSRMIWEPQRIDLSKNATLVSVDLRGHGESFAFDGAYSMDMLADDCMQVLDSFHITTPIVVCGLSMGGYVTMALYRKYPNIFAGMILTSTRPGPDSQEAKANRDASIKIALEQSGKTIADNMIQKMFSPVTYKSKPNLVKSIHDIMATTSIHGIVGALQGMRDRPDSTLMISQIHCQVLIIHGTDDQLIPINEADLMHQQIPNSRLVKVSQAGHLPNLERPGEYNKAVLDFLSSLS